MSDPRRLAADVLRQAAVPFDRVSVLELDRSHGGARTIALLVFVDGAPRPTALIKATTDPAREHSLQVEYENLQRLTRGPASLDPGAVPRPLFSGRSAAYAVMAQTALAGTRMKNFDPDTYFASRELPRHLAAATGFLERLHDWGEAVTPALPVSGLDAQERVRRCREAFDVSPALARLLADVAERLDDTTLSPSPWHGDFCTANLLAEGDAIGVLDWEHPLERTLPLADFFHLLGSLWCVPYAKGRAALERNQQALFFESHRHASLLRDMLEAHRRRIGVPAELVTPLFAMGWLGHAELKRQELASAGVALEAEEAASHRPLVVLEGRRLWLLERLAERPDGLLPGG